MNQATQDFIRQHQDDDVRQLASSEARILRSICLLLSTRYVVDRWLVSSCLAGPASTASFIRLTFRWSNVRQSRLRSIKPNWLHDCWEILLFPLFEEKSCPKAIIPKFANLRPRAQLIQNSLKMKVLVESNRY